MKLPNTSRRNFIGSILTFFSFVSFKAFSSGKKTVHNKVFADPLANNPHFDLGVYHLTEIGTGLYLPTDISKVFHGYTDKISYKPGETVSLYLSAPESGPHLIELKDANGRVVFTFDTWVHPQKINTTKPWADGFRYNHTVSIKLPVNLKSGFYRFTGDIPLICKGTHASPDVTVIFPSNTYNAYCDHGGKSLYRPGDPKTEAAIYRSTVVSHARYNPVAPGDPGNFNESFFRWMEKLEYNTHYIADIDLEDYAEIANSKVVIISGKSEYWTRAARLNIDKFVASGKNVLVLSGNTMYWQVRHNFRKNLMVCYKSNNLDPLHDTLYSTYYWTTPELNYPVNTSIGADFIGGGYPMKVANPLHGFKIVQDASPLLKGTGLKKGDLLHLPTIETDGAPVKKMVLPGSAEIPEIDNSKLNFHKVELIGYTFSINPNNKPGLGTFMVFQKTPASGTVVNVASTDWCSSNGIGGKDSKKIETITKNMIEGSLNKRNLFSV